MEQETVQGTELQLGDIVIAYNVGAYTHSTVIGIDVLPGHVTLFRPYVHTSDFESIQGIIPFIGFEEWTCPISKEFTLIERRIIPVI